MKVKSIWNDIDTDNLKKLTTDLECDVLIIGGGMTGLSAMYYLKDSGLKTVLVERNTCTRGVTSKSTAKITYLQDNTTTNIANFIDENTAKKYLKSQIEAMNNLKNIIVSEKIDCDLKQVDSYLFTNEKKKIGDLLYHYEILRDLGIQVEMNDSIPFDVSALKSISVTGTYVFHPLKYLNFLKNKFERDIYEDTEVYKIETRGEYYYSFLENNFIKSKYVVLATHYPFFLIPFMMPMKTHIETSYLGAKKVDEFKHFSAISLDSPVKSIRYHNDGIDNYLIYLYDSKISCNIKSAKEHFDNLTMKRDFDYVWSNNDLITSDYMPYIGRLSKNNSTFLIATGYNTWGMTNATLSGMIIKDIITGKTDEYIELFDPKRDVNLSKILRFPLDLSYNIKSYFKSKFSDNSRVKYTKLNGQKVAIYESEDGVKHIVYNRCPHMGCGIKFNEVEKTWDCYCHGSRYDIDGKCIEGPSNENISFYKEKKKTEWL